jgi:hypothetical protein
LSKGKVNAKLVAPWYQHSIEQEENDGFIPEEKDIHQIQEELASLSIAAKGEKKENDERAVLKFVTCWTLR